MAAAGERGVGEGLRLAELLAALSLATDLAHQVPAESALKDALLSVAFARHLGLEGPDLSDVYYLALLRHLAYLISDKTRSTDPWCVLTGDSLFVGDVGRPDLRVGDDAFDVMDQAQRAEAQWRSIREKLLTLPEHVEVYPTHCGGSTCGGINMSGKASSTIWFEKRHNLALARESAQAFAAFVQETARPFPEKYSYIKSINRGLREAECCDTA